MEQKEVQLNQRTFSCCICLDLLKDLVTIPCGHSYCMRCIKNHWDGEDMKKIYSCPQCRRTFTARPVLDKNTMLADLVEELKKTGLGPDDDDDDDNDQCYAGDEDVVCDFCTGKKLKAVKSCLVCLVSYCHQHLQPHNDDPQFKKHKLVDPSEKLQENICRRHDEAMKMFCRTDGRRICYLCSVDQHKHHDAVSSAVERTEVEVSRLKIQQRIKDKQKDVKVLQQEVKNINRSADEAVENNKRILTQLIRLMEEKRRDVQRQIRSKQETEVIRVKELESNLQREINEQRRKDAQMDKLSQTHDHNQFLLRYPSVCELREDQDSFSVDMCPLSYFKDVTTAVSELRDKVQLSLTQEWNNMTLRITQTQILLQHEPQTRAEFLTYSRQITLDPNTVNEYMLLSEENKRVTWTHQKQNYSHPDRFSNWYQVLSRESLTGRCYWEVEWSGGGVTVTVAYKDIKRNGNTHERIFGFNDKSWPLCCNTNTVVFQYNRVQSSVPGPVSSRIGVYLDHTAGVLSFYNVSDPQSPDHIH